MTQQFLIAGNLITSQHVSCCLLLYASILTCSLLPLALPPRFPVGRRKSVKRNHSGQLALHTPLSRQEFYFFFPFIRRVVGVKRIFTFYQHHFTYSLSVYFSIVSCLSAVLFAVSPLDPVTSSLSLFRSPLQHFYSFLFVITVSLRSPVLTLHLVLLRLIFF